LSGEGGERVSKPAAIGGRSDYGSGCYRRRIELHATGDEVRGELGDDFHHFAVVVRHDRAKVKSVAPEAIRVPWTTCPGALVPLERMRDAALASPLLDLTRHTPAKSQCTHLHDLTCLAIAHAARAGGETRVRRYDIAVPDRVDRRTCCTLTRDDDEILTWELEGLRIRTSSVAAFDGLQIGSKPFREAMRGAGSADETEAAWILQRAIFIGLGRQHDFDAMPSPSSFAQEVGGSCHAFAAERIDEGVRQLGNVHDFTDDADALLSRALSNVDESSDR